MGSFRPRIFPLPHPPFVGNTPGTCGPPWMVLPPEGFWNKEKATRKTGCFFGFIGVLGFPHKVNSRERLFYQGRFTESGVQRLHG